MDGTVRWRPAITSMILVPYPRVIPGGWNSQNDTSDNKHYPWPVKGVMERTELIPVGWNSKKKVSNIQQNHGPV